MKKTLALLVFALSFSAFANAKLPCKIEAQTAAAELYQQENPGVGFTLRAKYKPVAQDNVIYHMVEILEHEGGKTAHLTVTVNAKTCAVLSID